MTVEFLASEPWCGALCLPHPEREIEGAYIGDLLSWVMGRAEASCCWITIMSSINVVAVATLADVSCILLAEGVALGDDVLSVAKEKGVNVLTTELSAYEAAKRLSMIIE